MPIEFKSTRRDTVSELNILILGPPGAGKTSLIQTLPAVKDERILVITSELGSEVLRNRDFMTVELDQRQIYTSLMEVLRALHGKEHAGKYDWVCLDSLTDISEKHILWCKKNPAEFLSKNGEFNGLAMYSDLKMKILAATRNFLAIPGAHKLVIAASTERQDGVDTKICMNMEGKARDSVPFIFDEVYHMKVQRGDAPGEVIRRLVTNQDGVYHDAKSRMSGPAKVPLDLYETMDVGKIIKKCYEGTVIKSKKGDK